MSIKKDSKHKLLKCIFVGENDVGKSAIFYRFFNGVFPQYPTCGLDFKIFPLKIGNEEIRYQFWDLYQTNRDYRLKCYQQTSILIMTYDITNRHSFLNIQNYYEDFVKYGIKKSVLALVGNKNDQKEFRQVSFLEGQELGESLGVEFFEVSALTGYKIKDLYDFLINKSIERSYF